MLSVITVVAPLTEGTQVRRVTMFGNVVEVGNRKDYSNHLLRLLVEEPRMILSTAELTMVPGPIQNTCTNLLPVGGVTAFILWSYWHTTILLVYYALLRLFLFQTGKLQ